MANITAKTVLVFALLVWVFNKFIQKTLTVRRVLQQFGDCPGETFVLLRPFRVATMALAGFLPPKGFIGHYFAKFSSYATHGCTCIRAVVLWDNTPTFWLADGEAIREVMLDRATFPKEVEPYEILNVYGPSVASTDGATWKRHKAVVMPAFSEANNALLWQESLRVIDEWSVGLEEKKFLSNKDPVIDTVQDFEKITLLILAAASFGRRISWSDDPIAEPGYTKPFVPAVMSAVKSLEPRGVVPTWLEKLSCKVYLPLVTPAVRGATESFEELRRHMIDLISSSRAWVSSGKRGKKDAALLANLVEANMREGDGGNKTLTDDELLSNTFIFFIAGHETSAHTLSFALALLALYPEVQNKVLQEVEHIWSREKPIADPTSWRESFSKLEYTLAVVHETTRLFTPIPRLSKLVSKNTQLKAKKFEMLPNGDATNIQEIPIDLMAGSIVILDINALHHNPIYWGSDVMDFKPERFLDTETYRWPRDGYMAFAAGPRACVGQRFALIQAVSLIAQIVRKFEIALPDEVMKLSRDKQEKLLLNYRPGVTNTPTYSKIKLRPRNSK